MTEHEVVVIGAGISGIGAGVRLRQAGITDFVILEAAHEVGGTWRANTYPGCACDVPSRLYSYSFAPNPEWTRTFAGQQEILDYVQRVARDHRLEEHTRLGVRMERAQWDAGAGRWRLETSAGPLSCRFLVAGAGPWNEPNLPDLPGLADFPGPVFHSARWDHDVPLAGSRVAVIGTGASAVQFVPQIRQQAQHVHLFQRTAQWVLPKPDHYVPRAERWAMRAVPGSRAAVRAVEYAGLEAVGLALRHPRFVKILEGVGRAYLRAVVRDPALRAKLTPSYALGCKRLLLSNDYLQALTQPNVSLHASAVERVEGRKVVGADGSRAEVDAIILGTGFRILDMPLAEHLHDEHGTSLAQHWRGSPEAYLGTMSPVLPNAFLLLGPSLGTGHSSAFTILEAQLDLVMSAISAVRDDVVATIRVRREAHETYVAEVQDALGGTVYNTGGCRSYYFDSNGRNSFSWPWSTGALVRRVSRFEPDDFEIAKAPGGSTVPPVGLEPTLRGF